jgi:hypothetical protein
MKSSDVFFIILIVFCICGFYEVNHRDYNQEAIQAIVGEAANQSEDTMICIAHAIRNRGTLKGVYGLNAKHVWSEPDWVWRNAMVAWDLSGHEKDVVNGAKNFGTRQDLDKQDFSTFTIKAHCGDFYFY